MLEDKERLACFGAAVVRQQDAAQWHHLCARHRQNGAHSLSSDGLEDGSQRALCPATVNSALVDDYHIDPTRALDDVCGHIPHGQAGRGLDPEALAAKGELVEHAPAVGQRGFIVRRGHMKAMKHAFLAPGKLGRLRHRPPARLGACQRRQDSAEEMLGLAGHYPFLPPTPGGWADIQLVGNQQAGKEPAHPLPDAPRPAPKTRGKVGDHLGWREVLVDLPREVVGMLDDPQVQVSLGMPGEILQEVMAPDGLHQRLVDVIVPVGDRLFPA